LTHNNNTINFLDSVSISTHTDEVIFNNNAYKTAVSISTARTHTNGVICNNNA